MNYVQVRRDDIDEAILVPFASHLEPWAEFVDRVAKWCRLDLAVEELEFSLDGCQSETEILERVRKDKDIELVFRIVPREEPESSSRLPLKRSSAASSTSKSHTPPPPTKRPTPLRTSSRKSATPLAASKGMASEPPIKVMARAAEPAMASEGTPDESLAKEISFDDEAEVSINRSPISSNTSQRSQDVDITPIVCILDPKQNLPAVQATGHSKGKDTLETVWDHGLPPNPDFDPIPYINNFPAGLSGPFNYIAPTHAHLGSRDQLRAHIDPPGLIIPNPPVTTTEATLRPTIVTIAALLIANHGLFVTHTIPWLQITLLRNGCPTKLEPIQMALIQLARENKYSWHRQGTRGVWQPLPEIFKSLVLVPEDQIPVESPGSSLSAYNQWAKKRRLATTPSTSSTLISANSRPPVTPISANRAATTTPSESINRAFVPFSSVPPSTPTYKFIDAGPSTTPTTTPSQLANVAAASLFPSCSPPPTRTSSRRKSSNTPTAGDNDDELHNCPHPGCDKSFNRHSVLLAHLPIHSPASPRPYTCPICQRTFIRPHDMSRHARLIHNETRVFSCVLCNEIFDKYDECKKHEYTKACTASTPDMATTPGGPSSNPAAKTSSAVQKSSSPDVMDQT